MASPEAARKMEHSFVSDDGLDDSQDSNGHQDLSQTFEVSDEDVESGISKPRRNWSRWMRMGTRERKTYSPEGRRESEEEADGLLSGESVLSTTEETVRIRKRWHERLLCGGNTALSIWYASDQVKHHFSNIHPVPFSSFSTSSLGQQSILAFQNAPIRSRIGAKPARPAKGSTGTQQIFFETSIPCLAIHITTTGAKYPFSLPYMPDASVLKLMYGYIMRISWWDTTELL
jgi:hypothetical protein